MKNTIVILLCLICAFAPFITLGFNYFAFYQLLPAVVFYIFKWKVYDKLKPSDTTFTIFYIFTIAILLVFPLTIQIMWYFDINNLASGSSTSGLLFVFLPIYAILPGTLISGLDWIINRISRK